jgi:alanine dehydrogenase
MLLLTEHDVRQLLSIDDLIEAMYSALAEFSSGRVQQPLRTVLEIGSERAFFGVMPAYMPKHEALGTKLVTVFARNAAVGLPTHLAVIVLLDSTTGELLSLMDGRFITEARTAAVSAVSAGLLAREDAGVLAMIGSGVQARSHLAALSRVRRLREVRVWSRTEAHRRAFADEMQNESEAPIRAVASPEQAVEGADLIVLATASREPVVRSEWIAPGAHIAAVGACRPDQREMDSALVGRARVFVDSRSGALAEAGDIVIAIRDGCFEESRIAGELGELAAGRVAGRTSADEITLFKSLGLAVEDTAAASVVAQRAQRSEPDVTARP